MNDAKQATISAMKSKSNGCDADAEPNDPRGSNQTRLGIVLTMELFDWGIEIGEDHPINFHHEPDQLLGQFEGEIDATHI